MRVAAVSFDADDTLWDFTAVMRRALTVTLRQLRQWYPGPATEGLTIDDMITTRESVASKRTTIGRSWRTSDALRSQRPSVSSVKTPAVLMT